MRKFILSSLELFSRIAIFLILMSGTIQGIASGRSLGGGILGGVIGFLSALLASVVIFGVIFLLMEIAENTRRTAVALEATNSNRVD